MRLLRFAEKNKASKKFYCAFCDKPIGLKRHLDKHNTTVAHLAGKVSKAAKASA